MANGNGMKVEIFDPPMCCPTGLCGPSIDKTLIDVNEMILHLKKAGVQVERYMMTQQPQAFVRNPDVFRLVRERQVAALPITVVNGRLIKVGGYPSATEVRAALKEDA